MFVKEMTVTMTTQTTATSKSKKWLWIRFFKILPLQLRKKKHKILPESTPDPWPPLQDTASISM